MIHYQEHLMPNVPLEMLAAQLRHCETNLDVQKAFFHKLLHDIMQQHSDGFDMDASSLPDTNPLRLVINRQLTLPPHLHLFDGSTPTLVFTENSAKDFKKAFIELKQKGAKSLIIDLRDNGGGSLSGSEEASMSKPSLCCCMISCNSLWKNAFCTSRLVLQWRNYIKPWQLLHIFLSKYLNFLSYK